MSVSVLNSRSNIDVPTGYIFNGVYEDVVEYSQILLNIRANNTTDNNYTLLIEFSPDRINVVSNETSTVIFDYNKLWYITPLSRFFRITLTALSNIQNLVIQTLYKNDIVYKAINQISGFVFVDNMPEIQAVSGNVNITNTGFTSNIIASVPLEISNLGFTSNIIASVPLEISNLGFTSNIISSIDLDVNVLTLPALTITNTGFTSNIISSIDLDVNVLTLPALTITNTGFTSNITAIDSSLTFLTQERPTTETFFTTTAGNAGIWISGSTKVIRNMSINTISSVIVYVYLYDLASIPTNLDTPTFVFTVKDSNNVVFNPLDHKFVNGLSIRATTTYNGIISPALNSVFINMTLSD